LINKILTEELELWKTNCRWTSHAPTADENGARVTILRQLLTFLAHGSERSDSGAGSDNQQMSESTRPLSYSNDRGV
jgi:hypothetical protein